MSEGFEAIDTHKINMKRITKNIAIALLGIVIWTLSEETYAQCRVDNNNPVQGEFKINNIQIKGDGGNLSTASNNIPIKICEGELITLKNTIVGISNSISVSYWITEEASHRGVIPNPIPSTPAFSTVRYTPPTDASVDVKMIGTTDPLGFSSYGNPGPGRYVIYQYDNTPTGTLDPTHYACQVIEIIKPEAPVVSAVSCSSSEVKVTFANNPANKFDDYQIKYTQVPAATPNPFLNTGKITTYPYTHSSGITLSGLTAVNVTVKGESVTGGCPAPFSPPINISLNNNPIFKPTLAAIVGTTVKGEFKLAVSADNGVRRNVYIRDPTSALLNQSGFNKPSYDYTTNFKNYSSTATSGLDSTIIQVPDKDKIFCFQIEAVDGLCASSSVSNPALRSDELCTTVIDVKAEFNQNVISWAKVPGGGLVVSDFVNFKLDRYLADGTFEKSILLSTDRTITGFTDTQVICGRDYVYKLYTRYPFNSISQTVKVRAISNTIPDKIPFAFATISNAGNSVRVQGKFDATNPPTNVKPNAFNYYRAESLGGNYTLLKSGNSSIDDITADIDKKSYCYYMTWTNLCNNESAPSEKMCTVFLKADGSNLKWTPEASHSITTDSYIVQKVNPATKTNIKELATNLIGIHNFDTRGLDESEGQEIYVQIESRPKNWQIIGDPNILPFTSSNIVRIFRPSFSLTPEIFTPNGDTNNDKFVVKGKFIKKLKMSIYDRWGNVIYYEETDSFPLQINQTDANVVGWNGMMNNGNKASEGSYAYKIEIEDTIGQVTMKEGALLLAY